MGVFWALKRTKNWTSLEEKFGLIAFAYLESTFLPRILHFEHFSLRSRQDAHLGTVAEAL
jgi:hypothetical protein